MHHGRGRHARSRTRHGAGARAQWGQRFSLDIYECHACAVGALGADGFEGEALRVAVLDEEAGGADGLIGECLLPLAEAVREAQAARGEALPGVRRSAWLELRPADAQPGARSRVTGRLLLETVLTLCDRE